MRANIAIASTLKPLIDPRSYEKIGRSLAESGNYEVHIIGSLPTLKEGSPHISLYPIASNTKGSLKRIFLPWKILFELIRIKPELLIFNTHELLFIGVLFKFITGRKLVYDVRENYYFNLLYQKNYIWGIRHLLAIYVRLKEFFLSKYVDHFLLAEQCYADEIKFLGSRFTIVENKFKAPEIIVKKPTQTKTELIYSGTISKEYGVFDILHIFKDLPPAEFKLIIVGHCPNQQTLKLLKREAEDIENTLVIASINPLPHADILSHIGERTIGLLPYQPNKSTVNKMPTKLYEYIGLGIPVLISPNPLWAELIERYQAGLNFDFQSPLNIDEFRVSLNLINNTQHIDLKDIMWCNEEIKLISVIDSLLSSNT